MNHLIPAFLRTAGEVLARIGVSAAAIQSELSEMAEGRIARTSSRQVLGSMNDFVNLADGYSRSRDLVEIAVRLSQRLRAVRSGCVRHATLPRRC